MSRFPTTFLVVDDIEYELELRPNSRKGHHHMVVISRDQVMLASVPWSKRKRRMLNGGGIIPSNMLLSASLALRIARASKALEPTGARPRSDFG
jgi:hypothetical protein